MTLVAKSLGEEVLAKFDDFVLKYTNTEAKTDAVKLRTLIEELISSPPKDLNLHAYGLGSAVQDMWGHLSGHSQAMRQLGEIQVTLQTLLTENNDLKVEVASLKQQVSELQSEKALAAKLMIIYDLTFLYNYYVTIPVITATHQNLPQTRAERRKAWNKFTDLLTIERMNLEDKVISLDQYNASTKLIDIENVIAVPIDTLRDLADQRHRIAYSKIKSALDQKNFLSKATQELKNLPESLKIYAVDISVMLNGLVSLQDQFSYLG